MSPEKSGLYYPNKIARIYLLVLEDIMGKNGLNAILKIAGLAHLVDNYPPDDLHKDFDFADFAALNQGLDEMYGPRGGRGLAMRAGRAAIKHGLDAFGPAVGMTGFAMKALPLSAKLKIGLPAMAKVFTQFSDQISRVEEHGDHFVYIIERCPVCWGRHSDKPICHAAVGLLQGGLHWVSGGKEFRVREVQCIASGDSVCSFEIPKEPVE